MILDAIRDAVQTDPGRRGLDQLFAAFPADFAEACRGIANHSAPVLEVLTGFCIPTAEPPAFETDGPPGAMFLKRALEPLGIRVRLVGELAALMRGVLAERGEVADVPSERATHAVAIERAGPAGDGRCYTMRGRDTSEFLDAAHNANFFARGLPSIAVGDGGNELGMGRIPHELIAANIPDGARIHCRVAADRLIVAGVSNWGAYALAGGIYALRGIQPGDVFDPARELAVVGALVKVGGLVDGVTGRRTATVDGLAWGDYAKPLERIRSLLAAHSGMPHAR